MHLATVRCRTAAVLLQLLPRRRSMRGGRMPAALVIAAALTAGLALLAEHELRLRLRRLRREVPVGTAHVATRHQHPAQDLHTRSACSILALSTGVANWAGLCTAFAECSESSVDSDLCMRACMAGH